MAVNLHRLGLPLRDDVGALVTAFLEIAPGFADTKKNVERLLAYMVNHRGGLMVYDGPPPCWRQVALRIEIRNERRRNRMSRFVFTLTPAIRCDADYINQKTFFRHRYDATTTGLRQGLAEVKSWVKVLKRVPDDPPRSCKRPRTGGCQQCVLSNLLGCESGGCSVCGTPRLPRPF
jgi:hypothetical protein